MSLLSRIRENASTAYEAYKGVRDRAASRATGAVKAYKATKHNARKAYLTVRGLFQYMQDVKAKLHEEREEYLEELRVKLVNEVFVTLSKHLLFCTMDYDQRDAVVDEVSKKRYDTGDFVYGAKNPLGMRSYQVVITGSLKVVVPPGKIVYNIKPGGGVGRLQELYDCPSTVTVVANEPTVTWLMPEDIFEMVGVDVNQVREYYDDLLIYVPIFSDLTPMVRSFIADCLRLEDYEASETIVKQGDVGHEFFVLETGNAVAKLRLPDGEVIQVAEYERGGFFGEVALLTSGKRAASVVAVHECRCATLHRDHFQTILLLPGIKAMLMEKMEQHKRKLAIMRGLEVNAKAAREEGQKLTGVGDAWNGERCVWDDNLDKHPAILGADKQKRLVKFLYQSLVFDGLTLAQMKKVVSKMVEVFVGQGQALLEEGDPVKAIMVLDQGVVEILEIEAKMGIPVKAAEGAPEAPPLTGVLRAYEGHLFCEYNVVCGLHAEVTMVAGQGGVVLHVLPGDLLNRLTACLDEKGRPFPRPMDWLYMKEARMIQELCYRRHQQQVMQAEERMAPYNLYTDPVSFEWPKPSDSAFEITLARHEQVIGHLLMGTVWENTLLQRSVAASMPSCVRSNAQDLRLMKAQWGKLGNAKFGHQKQLGSNEEAVDVDPDPSRGALIVGGVELSTVSSALGSIPSQVMVAPSTLPAFG